MRRSVNRNVFLGLDPGIHSIGYGVIETRGSRVRLLAAGLLVPKKRSSRYREAARELRRLIIKWRPDAAGIEKILFSRNARTAIAVAEMIGALKLAAEESGIFVSEYSPSEIKRTVTGKGTSPKQVVGKMVGAILGLSSAPTPHHAADALAVALTLERHEKSTRRD